MLRQDAAVLTVDTQIIARAAAIGAGIEAAVRLLLQVADIVVAVRLQLVAHLVCRHHRAGRRAAAALGSAIALALGGPRARQVHAIERLAIEPRRLLQAFAVLIGGDRFPRLRSVDAVDRAVIEALALKLFLRLLHALRCVLLRVLELRRLRFAVARAIDRARRDVLLLVDGIERERVRALRHDRAAGAAGKTANHGSDRTADQCADAETGQPTGRCALCFRAAASRRQEACSNNANYSSVSHGTTQT